MLSKNHPGRSSVEVGDVQMWNRNCILLALAMSGIDDIEMLLDTQPL